MPLIWADENLIAFADACGIKVHRHGQDVFVNQSLGNIDSLEQEFQGNDGLIRAARVYSNKILGVSGHAGQICTGYTVICPVTGKETSLYEAIIGLNDSHDWTREQIADWLDTLPDQPKWSLV